MGATPRPYGLIIAALLLAAAPASAREKPDALGPQNWTTAVGFAPESNADGWTPGQLLDAGSWEAARRWIPAGVATLVRDWGLRLRTASYRPIHPSTGYMEATLAHWGQPAARETGESYRDKGIDGYVAGLPFPQPETALEVAFNAHFSYQGDDGGTDFGVHWIDAEGGSWKSEEWRWIYARTAHRTDLPPRPRVAWFADRDIQYASVAWASAPGDKNGTRALFYRFETPRDQRGYLYIPSSRRTLKLVVGTPGVPWNVTDMLNEDVRGFAGYPEWLHWKLIDERTVLAPMHAGTGLADGRSAEEVFDYERPPHWNPNVTWEPRAVYVIEGRHKFWTSPYSRVLLYVDAETGLVPLKETYDAEDALWKVFINAYEPTGDMNRQPPSLALTLAVDVKTGHATAFPTHRVFHNAGLERALFTQTALRRAGR